MASPGPLPQDRRELIEYWRVKRDLAQSRYDKAQTHVREMECSGDDLAEIDVSYAYRKAIREETLASRELRLILKSYADVVLRRV